MSRGVGLDLSKKRLPMPLLSYTLFYLVSTDILTLFPHYLALFLFPFAQFLLLLCPDTHFLLYLHLLLLLTDDKKNSAPRFNGWHSFPAGEVSGRCGRISDTTFRFERSAPWMAGFSAAIVDTVA